MEEYMPDGKVKNKIAVPPYRFRVILIFIGWMLFFLATMALGEVFIPKVQTDLAEPLALLLLGLGFIALAYLGGKGLRTKK